MLPPEVGVAAFPARMFVLMKSPSPPDCPVMPTLPVLDQMVFVGAPNLTDQLLAALVVRPSTMTSPFAVTSSRR